MESSFDSALAAFTSRFDRFLSACADREAVGAWDVDRLGFMAAYFESDLSGVVMQMMSADGSFEQAEAEVFNRMFGTSLSAADLRAGYRDLKPVIEDYCDVEAKDALTVLGGVDATLREEYRMLILEAATVISLCDGIAEGEEAGLIARLQQALGD